MSSSTYQLVLLRHGQSEWNLSNRFTGWADVDLTPQGRDEAAEAGRLMDEAGFAFDVAYTSVQKRAIRTNFIALDAMNQLFVPVIKDWHLNERHYGALQGLNKTETAQQYGEDQVFTWRRSYDVPPPELTTDSPHYPGNDRRYAHLSPAELPKTESLKLAVARVVPYWQSVIAPQVKAGKQVIITAHGNSLRALIKHLDGMSEEAITELNIPTGVPLVYTLNADLTPLSNRYLGNAEAVAAAAKAVAMQGKA